MNSIYELMCKLPQVVETAINCYAKNQSLFAVKDGTYCLQMTWYWWKSAETELLKNPDGDIVATAGDNTVRQLPKSPTLISSSEQLEYMISQLDTLGKEAKQFMDEACLPPEVQYRVERGYDRLTEAMFNMQIAVIHNAELNRK